MHKTQQGIFAEHFPVQKTFEEYLFDSQEELLTVKTRPEFFLIRGIHLTDPVPDLFNQQKEQEYQPEDKRKDKQVKSHIPEVSNAVWIESIRFLRLTPRGQTSWHLPHSMHFMISFLRWSNSPL
jgi:hypothetical protein